MFKKLIQEKLDLLKEANPRASSADYYRTMYRVAILTKNYTHDEYYMGENLGEFIAAAIVDIRGNIRISQVAKVPAGDLKANRLGITRETKDYLQFYVMAGRGIQHPNTEKELPDETAMSRDGINSSSRLETFTKTVHLKSPIRINGQETSTIEVEVPKPGSPASDAQIKTYLLYGPMIIDFVEKNLAEPIGYRDGKAPEIRNAMDIKQKIQIIRKDAEDSLETRRLPRVGFIEAFNEFKETNILSLSAKEQEAMDTTDMTKKFMEFYINKSGASSKRLSNAMNSDDAAEVYRKQAEAKARIAAAMARRKS